MARLAYANDGISTYDELFLNSLKEKYDVQVLTFHPSPTYIPFEIETIKMADPIPWTNLHPFEGVRKHFLTLVRARIFKKHLLQIKPDALIGCWASTYGFYSAYSNFHPFILFVWGSDILIFPKKYFPLKPLVVYSLRKADVVVVDSDIQREVAINLGCEPQKIVQFPWVNLKKFKKDEEGRKKIRAEHEFSDEDIVVISLRSHNPIYGVEYLIDAIPFIIKRNKNIKFLILGEGSLTMLFKEKMEGFIKSGQVDFVGNVPHDKVAEYLSAADIYVSTSFSDGTSASLLEAMACSLPSVVTEIQGNKEWVKNEVNGLLVPVANSEKLAEKILLLANDYKLRKALQTKAEETARIRVNWQKTIQRLTKIIDERISI